MRLRARRIRPCRMRGPRRRPRLRETLSRHPYRSVPPRPGSSPLLPAGPGAVLLAATPPDGQPSATAARHSPGRSRPASDRRPGRSDARTARGVDRCCGCCCSGLVCLGGNPCGPLVLPCRPGADPDQARRGDNHGAGPPLWDARLDCSTSRSTGEDVTLETQPTPATSSAALPATVHRAGRTYMRGREVRRAVRLGSRGRPLRGHLSAHDYETHGRNRRRAATSCAGASIRLLGPASRAGFPSPAAVPGRPGLHA